MTKHIAIIGAGNVGSTTAYALCLKNIASMITLIDIDKTRCRGEMLDLSDAIPFSSTTTITSGTFEATNNADIIIITAGRAQEPGEPREKLLNTNKTIIESIVSKLNTKPSAIIIVVTNPVDTLTYYVHTISKLPSHQIIGTGTLLDTQRLKQTLAYHTHISPKSITALMLGEHGDSQFAFWSGSSIQGMALEHFGITTKEKRTILEEVRKQVYDIIACKGSTYYGIAMCIASLCEIIFFDQCQIVPLSCFVKELDICVSLPAVLGQHGIKQILIPSFTDKEKQDFDHCLSELQKTKQILKH